MARNGVNKTLLISTFSFLKNLFSLIITIPILFLSKVLHITDVFRSKSSKSCLHGREELESQETKTNLDYEEEEEEEEEGLIEITLARETKEGWMSKEEYYQEMTIMDIWEELEAEENLIEIDISIQSTVNNTRPLRCVSCKGFADAIFDLSSLEFSWEVPDEDDILRHCFSHFFLTKQLCLGLQPRLRVAMAMEVAVFVETNLGTRIAMTVSLDITSPDFKRKLEETHASCLPTLGEIRVHALMVHRKSQFYYIAQSVPIKFIFRDNHSKPWFIHAEATLVNRPQEPSISNCFGKSQIVHCSRSNKSPQGVVGLIPAVNKKTKKREFFGSETIVRSSLSTARNSKCFIPKTPERETGETASKKSETISNKLIVAANNIRMQGKSSMSCSLSSSIFKSKNRRKRCIDAKTLASLAKFMVFEIPDTED
ncbi:hypothetical protein IGI04_018791 [Brassica rapa subsp. trilocularis]|uniref:Uncharacterized protein n=1 Tax=Brassica rapa subsp. trilocularis TaxID=1813537 RepID=A0ABQ7MDZ2_BRACM|nr:hypothetical protein IGI04_018791 [Brassica rapa subsp. trilocularis]